MRNKLTLSWVMVLALCGTCAAAQEPDENQVQTQQEDSVAEPAAATAGTGGVGKKSTAAPTLFVPRETISPDSVIAFPADI